MKKINVALLIVAAVTSIVFLFVVESFNNITLDDLGFALQLQKESLWNFILEMYYSWEGRFMGFFVTGVQLKSYFLFNTMLPFSILLYILNILLIARSLINFFKLKPVFGLLYSLVFFQLYVYSMLDISSYFWLCTKAYTLYISLSLYALSILLVNDRLVWYDYVKFFIVFAFLGCSYEIYAPIIILSISCLLFFRLHRNKYDFRKLASENKKLLFSLLVGILFFSLMAIAPGNWLRMKAQAPDLIFSDFIGTAATNSFYLLKQLFLKIQYFLIAGFLLWTLFQQLNISSKNIERTVSLKRLLSYAFICLGLSFISVMLSTYAIGTKMALRAFNHINLFVFIFIALSLYEFVSFRIPEKLSRYVLPLAIIFIIVCNIYSTLKSMPELHNYKESLLLRSEKLEHLHKDQNKAMIKLEPLYVAEFHSADDLWKTIIPKYSPRVLLKPDEVTNDVENYYNKLYRKYYKLDFDVVTDIL